MKSKAPFVFLLMGVSALLLGAFFGTLLGVQYLFPDFLKDTIAFNRLRPFHVTTVTSWIILTATGGIYYYLTEVMKLELFSKKLMKAHLIIFAICAAIIYITYSIGVMGGREYFAYAPIISIPILLGWILFAFNYFKTVIGKVTQWPVYMWMWGTGLIFMIYHFSEAHFYLIPYFRENFVRDLTVQWKSYGSFVGSWNMLLYGTATFMMSKIKGDDSVGRGKITFFFYFLGLSNLMLGWAHHTYFVPSQTWVRYLAYGVSMTEWIILIRIIITWKKSLEKEKKAANEFAYKFLMGMEFWVFFNLIFALLISIPTLNFFTHGTHITVAHSMGTTIGINTSILLASILFIATRINKEAIAKSMGLIRKGFWVFNSSLMIFLLSLFAAGVKKSVWLFFVENPSSFGEMHDSLQPMMLLFLFAGIGVLIGLMMITIPVIKIFINRLKQ